VIGMARALTDLGAVVIGADIRQYLGSLKRSAQRAGAPCRMMAVPVLCVYGKSDSICPQLSAAGIARQQIGKGHHFSGEYAALADRILAFARSARP
jgi:type IV secretory pathway VirJ component